MNPACDVHWTAYVTALAVPLTAFIVSGIAAYIAYQQWQTARRKLKLDLFDRRYAVYEAANNLIETFVSPKSAPRGPNTDSIERDFEFNDQVVEWLTKMQVADWLVSNEVEEFLDQVARHAGTLRRTQYVIDRGSTTDEERDGAMERQQESRDWLINNHYRLKEAFTPYLRLEH